jgi:hypothetical protein
MHKVAIPAPVAPLLVELATPSLPELRHRGILCCQLTTRVPTTIQRTEGGGSLLLARVLDVHIADQMVAQVVTHHHLLNLAVLRHLQKDVLVEVKEAL